MMTCTKCMQTKPINCFYSDKSKKHGRMARCKECHNEINRLKRNSDPEKAKKYNKSRYWANKEKEQERHLLRKYGVSLSDYALMLHNQGGKCAICKRPQTRSLDVDHCHATGRVRGLLCTNCNRMIGHAADDSDRLRNAAAYLDAIVPQVAAEVIAAYMEARA